MSHYNPRVSDRLSDKGKELNKLLLSLVGDSWSLKPR